MGFHYDQSRGTIATALSCTNTVVPKVVSRVGFWIFLFIHLTVVVLYNRDIIPRFHTVPFTKIEWKEVEVISGITTFFQVFYISQCFGRYLQHYKHVRELMSHLTIVLLDIRLRARNGAPGQARCACRYILASAMMFFGEANPNVKLNMGSESSCTSAASSAEADCSCECALLSYREHSPDDPDASLHTQAAATGLNRLLKPAELKALQGTVKRYRPLVLLEWIIELNYVAYKRVKTPANAQQAITTRVFECSHIMRQLIDLLNLPVPFQYFHLLNLMVCINLLFWAYAMGASDAMGATAVFIAAELIFMGMMELANDLADPFGEGEVDFPINEWFHGLCSLANLIMEYKYNGSDPANWEALLAVEGRLNLSAPRHKRTGAAAGAAAGADGAAAAGEP